MNHQQALNETLALVAKVHHERGWRAHERIVELQKQQPEKLDITVSEHPAIIATIMQAIAIYYDFPVEEMTSKHRKREKVEARQMCMLLLVEYTRESLKNIGELFGKRDHTTVIHARETMKDLIKTDMSIASDYEYLSGITKKIIYGDEAVDVMVRPVPVKKKIVQIRKVEVKKKAAVIDWARPKPKSEAQPSEQPIVRPAAEYTNISGRIAVFDKLKRAQ
jgi:hypothetical protein